MERDWTYKEIKEVKIYENSPSELVAERVNKMFHDGEQVRTRADIDKVKSTLHVLFK